MNVSEKPDTKPQDMQSLKAVMAKMGQEVKGMLVEKIDMTKCFSVVGTDSNTTKELQTYVYKFVPWRTQVVYAAHKARLEHVKVVGRFDELGWDIVRSPFYDISLKQFISTGIPMEVQNIQVLTTMFLSKLPHQLHQLHQ